MKTLSLSASGRFPDICWDGEAYQVVWHEFADQALVVERVLPEGRRGGLTTWPLTPDASAFPRIAMADGAWWVAAKDGAPGYPARLWRLGSLRWSSPRACWGNDPIALGDGWIAWQTADRDVIVAPIVDAAHGRLAGRARPTGLSRVLADGTVKFVDEDRAAVGLGTRPCWAGEAVVVEGPEGGALVRRADGSLYHAWPGDVAYTPRLAASPGQLAVVTWGPYGVRLGLIAWDDRSEQPRWYPEGTEVETLPFLLPTYGGLLESADGQVLCSVLTASREIACVKGDPARQEVWRWDDEAMYLVYDATDGRAQPYRIAPEPVWCRLRARVGERWDHPAARLIRRTADGRSTAHAFPVTTGVHAAGEHIVIEGIGPCRILVTTWAPGWPASGYEERHWWAIRETDGLRFGRVRYEEWRHGVLERRFDFTRLRTTERIVPTPRVEIPDPPIILPSPPSQEAPMSVQFPPRNETLAFLERLEARYRDEMQRPPRQTHVDAEGTAVWLESYLRYRVEGRDHESAIAAVMRDIDRVLGLARPS